jgi:hypothetical protein
VTTLALCFYLNLEHSLWRWGRDVGAEVPRSLCASLLTFGLFKKPLGWLRRKTELAPQLARIFSTGELPAKPSERISHCWVQCSAESSESEMVAVIEQWRWCEIVSEHWTHFKSVIGYGRWGQNLCVCRHTLRYKYLKHLYFLFVCSWYDDTHAEWLLMNGW